MRTAELWPRLALGPSITKRLGNPATVVDACATSRRSTPVRERKPVSPEDAGGKRRLRSLETRREDQDVQFVVGAALRRRYSAIDGLECRRLELQGTRGERGVEVLGEQHTLASDLVPGREMSPQDG